MTLDCAGGSARIAGSHNKITLTGGCTRLTIFGSSDAVRVRSDPVPVSGSSVREMKSFGRRRMVENQRLFILASTTPYSRDRGNERKRRLSACAFWSAAAANRPFG